MSGAARQIAAETEAAGRSQLEFDDNLLLPLLYGERDQHLDRIERQLGVSLVPRGNRLAIAGPASATEVARLALLRLYERLKGGQEIDLAAVDATMRLAQAEIEDKSLSLGRDDAGFRTRKRRIAPRSAAQAAYVKAMRENELVFGLGPAGTGKTYLAVAAAIDLLMGGQGERGILSRPALEALRDVENIAIVRFTEKDVVRHPLVARIVGAYDARDRARELPGRGGNQPK